MKRKIELYDVLLSCPGDAYEVCFGAVRDAISRFNDRAEQYRGIRLNLLHWSSDSFPQAGKPAQQLLNAQIVDKAAWAKKVFPELEEQAALDALWDAYRWIWFRDGRRNC